MGRLRCFWCRFRRESSGVAAVEFALLGPLFFLIIFMIIETAFVFIGDITLEQATARAGRTVRTGQVATSNQTPEAFKTELCKNIQVLLNCRDIKIDLRSYSSFASIPTQAPISAGRLHVDDFRFEQGNAGQIMALRVFYEYPLFTAIIQRFLSNLNDNKTLLTSTSVFQTEPF
jgi:Flp pilus assembly protein TadG